MHYYPIAGSSLKLYPMGYFSSYSFTIQCTNDCLTEVTTFGNGSFECVTVEHAYVLPLKNAISLMGFDPGTSLIV